ncbi:Mucosa-associated lymphoid tissue lymphoma translocation protein 1 [Danaus plexippus plexippus]|uniref:Mucosa-associated lymphoid tissue lymphoma translocation protein 1 n=1 Tax=Danaus plexippus plexippus TaxID=278856 RepID=A0A212EV13_DANPL|nr:Mucosa-associated lymphoid tissue lymphoma translocation protein 1 [Danaus plexippus plexippus]
MSLLQELSYKEYKELCSLSSELCQVIANLANLNIVFNDKKNPGQLLSKFLDRKGCSLTQYKNYLNKALNTKTIITYYKPQTKVAILLANNKYEHLSKLVTPSIDCDSLASNLKRLGFISIVVINTRSKDCKDILSKIFNVIPEDSYCFIFYAGHGCELCNTKCILSVDCPTEDIDLNHCVTENWLLSEVEKCKPEMCVLIMDMCRKNLERETNPKIYSNISNLENYSIHRNLIICYSTQSSQSAYELLQIEHSESIDNDLTYELRTGDTDKILPFGSQYVNVLCSRIGDDFDISTLLDKVHEDVENSSKKQIPIKVQCGVSKRSLYDPVKGDMKALLDNLTKLLQEYVDNDLLYFVH